MKAFIKAIFEKPYTTNMNSLFFYYFYLSILFLSVFQLIGHLLSGQPFLNALIFWLGFVIVFTLIFRFKAILNFLKNR